MTYHDSVLSLYIKILPKYLGFKLEFYRSISHSTIFLVHWSEILTVFEPIQGKNLLFVPWWLNLSEFILAIYVAIINVTLINGGLYHGQYTSGFQKAKNLLTQLKDKASVTGEFVWTLKMVSYMRVLRYKESLNSVTDIGIDHGANNVKKASF